MGGRWLKRQGYLSGWDIPILSLNENKCDEPEETPAQTQT